MSADFDTRVLLQFNPPRLLCYRCRGLLSRMHVRKNAQREIIARSCPVCNLTYVKQGGRSPVFPLDLETYLSEVSTLGIGSPNRRLVLRFTDPLRQSERLAAIAQQIDEGELLPLQGLIAALSAAQQFVHFVSLNVDGAMCGILSMVAQHAYVAGLVGKVSSDYVTDAVERLKLNIRMAAEVHQKLIVIDGLLAFTGGANLSLSAWHNSGEPRKDYVKAVTRLEEVEGLNNEYFARHWATVGGALKGETLVEVSFPPLDCDPEDIPL